jgi:hypothetical protein
MSANDLRFGSVWLSESRNSAEPDETRSYESGCRRRGITPLFLAAKGIGTAMRRSVVTLFGHSAPPAVLGALSDGTGARPDNSIRLRNHTSATTRPAAPKSGAPPAGSSLRGSASQRRARRGRSPRPKRPSRALRWAQDWEAIRHRNRGRQIRLWGRPEGDAGPFQSAHPRPSLDGSQAGRFGLSPRTAFRRAADTHLMFGQNSIAECTDRAWSLSLLPPAHGTKQLAHDPEALSRAGWRASLRPS